MTTAVAAPFRFFSLQVVRTRRLGPSLVRITFAGADLAGFASHGRDQSLSSSCRTPARPSRPSPTSWATAGGRGGANSPTTYGR